MKNLLLLVLFACVLGLGLIVCPQGVAEAAGNPYAYICESGVVSCDQLTASFEVYQDDADTYFVCVSGAPACNSINAIYTAVRDSGSDFNICKGGSSICNVANGDAYMEKNDRTSFYVCKGNLPVCNVANGDYYIEKDTADTWDICESRIPVCNYANDSYIFKINAPTKSYTSEPVSYIPETTSVKAAVVKKTPTSVVVAPIPTPVDAVTFLGTSTPAQATTSEPVPTYKPSIIQRLVSWILSFF